MTTTRKLLWAITGFYVAGIVVLIILFGFGHQNHSFQVQNEFKLDNWLHLGVFSINRAVLYLILATILTVVTMVWIADRMHQRPNKVQTAVEVLFSLMRDNITRGNMPDSMAAKWFPFLGALFLFIWFNNLIGYIPLPTNSGQEVVIFGAHIPAFALYAATANISVTLILSFVVWIAYHVEGIRAKGFFGYFRSWLPTGTPRGPGGLGYAGIFLIEVISQFVRLISLSVRLFANILAGHLLILFMGGGLVVLLGLAALGPITFVVAVAFFMFEVVLIATLQAFIFATLASIYFGGATAAAH